jgi:alpha-glucosidase
MSWPPSADGVLTFDRGGGVCCVTNLSDVPVDLPAHTAVILASGPVTSNLLPPDSSIWLRT